MAKRLILLRHAKSSWADRTQSDFDRPLNDRGRRDAPAMGRFIIDNALAPEIIFCSPSKRTLETLALLQETIGDDAHVEFADGLYLAEAKTLLKIAQNAGSQYASAMIIAHNPGLEMLALKLADAGTSDADALARLSAKYPTTGLAVFDFDVGDWSRIAEHAGALRLFATPKGLERS